MEGIFGKITNNYLDVAPGLTIVDSEKLDFMLLATVVVVVIVSIVLIIRAAKNKREEADQDIFKNDGNEK